TEAAVAKALDLSKAEVLEMGGGPPGPQADPPIGLARSGDRARTGGAAPLLLDTEPVELEAGEVLIPISTGGGVTHLLRVFPGSTRPGLVTEDLNFLRAIATQCGHRLDALRRELETVERESREAILTPQITEAELRALRAQVNPHFLFNSLNTIADLIVRDPARAEAMTLRLARVFRHVLTQSSRPLTTIREEIEFLRTYLHIEEARFGDRLQVSIELAE